MTKDQEILTAVGQALFRQIPTGADSVRFSGFSYGMPENPESSRAIEFFSGDRFFPITRATRLDQESLARAHEMLLSLRFLPVFRSNQFNHYRFCLTAHGHMSFDVADIPEEDTWLGLHMKRVSELTEAEATEFGIPRQDWLDRVKRFA